MSIGLISAPTFSALRLRCLLNGNELGIATGFVMAGVVDPTHRYLVTANHALSGRKTNGEWAHGIESIPDEVEIRYNTPISRQWLPQTEKLYEIAELGSGECNTPRWIRAGKADVAVLPISIPNGSFLRELALNGSALDDVPLAVTQDVEILGYPYSWEEYPLWTRGTIASEPRMHSQNPDKPFYIDARTRKGQSGSPVLLYSPDGFIRIPGHGVRIDPGTEMGFTRLIGLYSGRIDEESDLGYAWPISSIERALQQAECVIASQDQCRQQ